VNCNRTEKADTDRPDTLACSSFECVCRCVYVHALKQASRYSPLSLSASIPVDWHLCLQVSICSLAAIMESGILLERSACWDLRSICVLTKSMLLQKAPIPAYHILYYCVCMHTWNTASWHPRNTICIRHSDIKCLFSRSHPIYPCFLQIHFAKLYKAAADEFILLTESEQPASCTLCNRLAPHLFCISCFNPVTNYHVIPDPTSHLVNTTPFTCLWSLPR